jgi:hypothetical protein
VADNRVGARIAVEHWYPVINDKGALLAGREPLLVRIRLAPSPLQIAVAPANVAVAVQIGLLFD